MGLWNILRQSKGLPCHECGGETLSGFVRFERGLKVGVLCLACSSYLPESPKSPFAGPSQAVSPSEDCGNTVVEAQTRG
jgi:hypothetical protein